MPFFLSICSVQLLLQTDLVMVSVLSEQATSAYAIPIRVAMVEMIVMVALGSVASVSISKVREQGRAATVAYHFLLIGAVCGLLMVPVGLIAYPQLALWISGDAEVGALAARALFWFALAAPFRMTAHIAVMALHARGDGAWVVRWRLIEVGVNAVLNGVLMFALDFGFEGCFIATLMVMMFSCVWSVSRLYRHVGILSSLPSWDDAFAVLKNAGWEGKRMLSSQLFALVGLMLFASSWIAPVELARLSAHSAGTALAVFVFLPLLALMRCLAFFLAPMTPQAIQHVLTGLFKWGVPLSVLAGVTLYLGGDSLGQWLYNQAEGARWWSALIVMVSLSLPLRYLNTLQRGALQAHQKFSTVAVIDTVSTWVIGLPLIVAGIYLDQPVLAFGYILLPELLICLWLVRRMKGLVLSKETARVGEAIP